MKSKRFKLREVHKRIIVKLSTPKTFFEVARSMRKRTRQIAPRLSELNVNGYIKDSGKRKLTQYGRPAIVWKKVA